MTNKINKITIKLNRLGSNKTKSTLGACSQGTSIPGGNSSRSELLLLTVANNPHYGRRKARQWWELIVAATYRSYW
jgi:hypothetical protein